MPKIGAAHPCFRKAGADAGQVVGELATANMTPNYSTASYYSDNSESEREDAFVNATGTIEINDLTIEQFALIFGATVSSGEGTEGEMTSNREDTAPEGEFAHYRTGLLHGVKYYEGFYYPRFKATRGAEQSQTKGNSTAFTGVSFNATAMADDNGDWEVRKRFTAEADAKAWVETKTGIVQEG
jgi:hypothetical protein